MVPRKGKERKGKTGCDLCEQERSPIFECQFRTTQDCTQWIDLCAECASVDRPIRDGFVGGIHFGREDATKSKVTRPRARYSASSPKNDPEHALPKNARRTAPRAGQKGVAAD